MIDVTKHRLIPVVVLNDPGRAAGLADALVAGGLPVAEVTLRTEAGLESIRTMASRDDILVGAGTVLTAGPDLTVVGGQVGGPSPGPPRNRPDPPSSLR